MPQLRNGRTTVMQHWSREYGQAAYFVDLEADQVSYDGINVVKKGELVTYTASSETELMLTQFSLCDSAVKLLYDSLFLSVFNNEI